MKRMRLSLVLGALALVLLPGPPLVRAADGEGRSRAPIPLHRPTPETPPEAMGSDLNPIVELEIAVDERGIVREVETLSIEPHSEHDALFLEAASAAMRAWRFAPALDESGTPTATTLSWKIRFPDRAAPQGETRRGARLDFGRSHDGFADEVRAILGMSWKQRHRMRDGIADTAKRLMDPTRIHYAENEFFGVYVDYGEAGLAEVIAQNLAAAWAATYRLFGERLPSLPAHGKVLVFVYGSEERFGGLVASVRGHGQAAGFYHASGLIAFHASRVTSEEILGVLVHEATHALMDRHVFGASVRVPLWLGEGFAEYMGMSDIKRGRLVPGSRKRRTARLVRAGPGGRIRGLYTTSWASIKAVKKAVKKGEALTLGELVSATPELFYGERVDLFYSQSWIFVHFLRHGEDDWGEEAFPRFILLVAEGFDARDALLDAYGAPPESFEDAYREYVRDF